jgi:ribosomal-protein-alanine N-acetyltransferase
MRVTLVRPARRHAAEFLAAVKRSRNLHRNLVTPMSDEEAYRKFLRHGRSPRSSNFFIVHRELGDLVGVINIEHIIRGFFYSAFLGYYAFEPHAGKGLMREGLILALEHAYDELKLHRLEANIQPANARSIALIKSLGFQLEGYSPKYLKISGRWRDHERYALLAEDWRARPKP